MATSVISVLSKVKNLGKELQCILPNIVFRDINLPGKDLLGFVDGLIVIVDIIILCIKSLQKTQLYFFFTKMCDMIL